VSERILIVEDDEELGAELVRQLRAPTRSLIATGTALRARG
jgi:hypothetical protein